MTLPETLDQWTLPVIEELLAQGYYENEFFDFKEMLPQSGRGNYVKGQVGLRKTCCAFANSNGGFLVFGIKDDATLPVPNRLVGFPPAEQFLVNFGNYPSQCIPSVRWKPKDSPIILPSGNVLHVIQIEKSWNVPHCVEEREHYGPSQWYCFMKRTNKGDEYMSYEEIRTAFLQYYEKRLKLQLLQAELRTIRESANGLMQTGQAPPRLGEFSLIILETTLADTYTLIMNEAELLFILTQIRTLCWEVNTKIQSILPIYYIQQAGREAVYANHNAYVSGRRETIINSCDTALGYLKSLISA